MSRTNQRLHSFLTLVALATALPAAYAQDPAPGATANPSTTASPPAAQSQTTAPPNSAAQPSRTAAVCFKLTMHCVDSATPKTKAGAGAGTKDAAAAQRPLNLTAPDIRTVVSPDELKEPLPSNEQEVQAQEAETVQVKGESGVPPDVPIGFGALWWALNHPSQAWRILTPSE